MTALRGASIPPFWQRLPAIFAYGLKPGSLAGIAAIAAGFAFARILPSIIGLAMYFVVLSGLFKMGFEVLDATARGRMEPPDSYLGRFGLGIFWKQFGLWLVVGGLVFQALASLPPILAFAVAVALVLGLPAMTLVLAFEHSLFAAINPVTLIELVRRIGAPYLLLCLVLAGLAVLLLVAARAAVGLFGGFFGVLAAGAVNAYFLLVMFHLLGYVIYQFHEDLGIEADEEGVGEGTLVEQAAQANPMAAEARTLLARGKRGQALALLSDATSGRGGDLSVHRLYHELLDEPARSAERARHAHLLMALELNAGEDRRALKVLQDEVAVDGDFQPGDGDTATALAQQSLRFGDHRLAIHLLTGFARRFPRHEETVPNYQTLARVLCEREGKDAEALEILDRLLKTFPDDPRLPEIKAYRTTDAALVGRDRSA